MRAARRSSIALALLVCVAGFVVAGLVGALVGLLAGLAPARTHRLVLLAAGLALFVTALLTILEAPLSVVDIPAFPENHGLANIGGAVAGVLLLAGIVGMLAERDPPGPPEAEESAARARERRIPRSTVVAILTVTLIAAVALGLLGDRTWEGAAIGLGVAVLIVAACLVLALRVRHRPATDRS